MKKRVSNRVFGRKKSVRKAMLFSIVRSVMLTERIQTTEAKAKEVRPIVERMITRGKIDTLASRRALMKIVSAQVTKKIVEDLSPRYKDRHGGYIRITKVAPRKSDGARMAFIEFVK